MPTRVASGSATAVAHSPTRSSPGGGRTYMVRSVSPPAARVSAATRTTPSRRKARNAAAGFTTSEPLRQQKPHTQAVAVGIILDPDVAIAIEILDVAANPPPQGKAPAQFCCAVVVRAQVVAQHQAEIVVFMLPRPQPLKMPQIMLDVGVVIAPHIHGLALGALPDPVPGLDGKDEIIPLKHDVEHDAIPAA